MTEDCGRNRWTVVFTDLQTIQQKLPVIVKWKEQQFSFIDTIESTDKEKCKIPTILKIVNRYIEINVSTEIILQLGSSNSSILFNYNDT